MENEVPAEGHARTATNVRSHNAAARLRKRTRHQDLIPGQKKPASHLCEAGTLTLYSKRLAERRRQACVTPALAGWSCRLSATGRAALPPAVTKNPRRARVVGPP